MPHVYYKVNIIKTGKKMFSQDEYRAFDKEEMLFKTQKEAGDFVKERYPKVKRVKMFVDKNGVSTQVGWIYCFKDSDVSHNSEKWLEQDWVEVTKVMEEVIV